MMATFSSTLSPTNIMRTSNTEEEDNNDSQSALLQFINQYPYLGTMTGQASQLALGPIPSGSSSQLSYRWTNTNNSGTSPPVNSLQSTWEIDPVADALNGVGDDVHLNSSIQLNSYHARSQSWQDGRLNDSSALAKQSHEQTIDVTFNPVSAWLNDSVASASASSSSSSSWSTTNTTALQRGNGNSNLRPHSIGIYPESVYSTPATTTTTTSSNCHTPAHQASFDYWSYPTWQPSLAMSNAVEASDHTSTIHCDTAQAKISLPKARHPFTITSDIVLRSKNGKSSLDVYYPKSRSSPIDTYPGLLACSSPPKEDFESVDVVKRPKQQPEKRRSNDDLYTPMWVRGEGTAREAWCSLCDPGSWLCLKKSAFWYHVRSCHGINTATGRIYDPPLQLKIHDDSISTTFGLCGQCRQWQPICTARRKRNFSAWFRHASICHPSNQIRAASPPAQLAVDAIASASSAHSMILQQPRVFELASMKRCNAEVGSPALSHASFFDTSSPFSTPSLVGSEGEMIRTPIKRARYA